MNYSLNSFIVRFNMVFSYHLDKVFIVESLKSFGLISAGLILIEKLNIFRLEKIYHLVQLDFSIMRLVIKS